MMEGPMVDRWDKDDEPWLLNWLTRISAAGSLGLHQAGPRADGATTIPNSTATALRRRGLAYRTDAGRVKLTEAGGALLQRLTTERERPL